MIKYLEVGIKIFLALIMFFATIMGATAFELDDIEDSFVLSAGDRAEGSFVTNALNPQISTDFAWIVLNNDENYIADGYSSYTYDISIPEDADVGIYRAVISISSDGMTEYLNVKISVQNKPFAFLFNTFNNPIVITGLWIFLFIIIVGFLLYQYMRFTNG